MTDVGRYLAGLWELIARAYRLDPAALAWVRDRPGVAAPVVGARDTAQLAASMATESV